MCLPVYMPVMFNFHLPKRNVGLFALAVWFLWLEPLRHREFWRASERIMMLVDWG